VKILLITCLALLSLSSFANVYTCGPTWGENVGEIKLQGDPVSNIYKKLEINEVPQVISQSEYESVYLYLYDARTNENSYALEVVNYSNSYDAFEMSVFGSDHIVLGSRMISRYKCLKD